MVLDSFTRRWPYWSDSLHLLPLVNIFFSPACSSLSKDRWFTLESSPISTTSYFPRVTDSWLLKQIIKRRNIPRNHISWYVGDGTDTFFWVDPWLNGNMLLDLVGNRLILVLGKRHNCKLVDVVVEGEWCFGGRLLEPLLKTLKGSTPPCKGKYCITVKGTQDPTLKSSGRQAVRRQRCDHGGVRLGRSGLIDLPC